MRVEGNNGGDFLEINETSVDNIVHLKVGHQCTYFLNMNIPVEVLTSILIDAIEDGKLTDPYLLQWDKDFNEELISQMEKVK